MFQLACHFAFTPSSKKVILDKKEFSMNFINLLTKGRILITTLLVIAGIALKIFVFETGPSSILRDWYAQMGALIAVLGLLLRTWAAGIIKKNKRLSTSGPYHVCRNPLYLGSFLIATGLIIILNEPYLWIILFVMILLYIPKIAQEEKKLGGLFPEDFPKYRNITGVFFPKKLSLDRITCRWALEQWLHNKEYQAWLAVLVAFMVFEIWNGI